MKFLTKSIISLIVLLSFGLLTVACENQNPVSHDSDTDATGSFTTLDAAAGQPVLDDGPLSAEQLNGITAPKEKIKVAEHDLKILKSKRAARLNKRFITSWNIPLGASGWAYAGDYIHGRCWLYFPLNAMNQSTTVTIDWESTGFLEGGAEFSPHGVQFNSPVTVWISYKDADLGDVDEEDLKIWYFNEDEGVWELIGDVVDTENKMVGGLLHHFSRYAIGTE